MTVHWLAKAGKIYEEKQLSPVFDIHSIVKDASVS
jgi:hypothetical protein